MDISYINKKDTYSLLLSAIYASESNDPDYRFLSDLLFCLDSTNFKNFISLFEGQTIKIPSVQRITRMLSILLIYAYHDVDKLTMPKTLKLLGIKGNEAEGLKREYVQFKQLIRDTKLEIGGVLDGFPSENSKIE